MKNTTTKRAAPQTNALPKKTTIYAARNTFRELYGKYVEPKNMQDLDVAADLWFNGDSRAFSFCEGTVVLHEVLL